MYKPIMVGNREMRINGGRSATLNTDRAAKALMDVVCNYDPYNWAKARGLLGKEDAKCEQKLSGRSAI